jgi:hypothetical protein
MKTQFHAIAIAMLAFVIHTAFAQQPASPPKTTAQTQPAAPSPAEVDKQVAKIQEQIAKMNEEMSKIQQTQDPQERQRLLQQHWTTMHGAMGMMQGMWGPGTTGGHMMGGHMMGGPMMMWGDYSNLTPEQLKQRQYMMDRWMPMQQMMMNHMMMHQGWMMQPPATPPARPSK